MIRLKYAVPLAVLLVLAMAALASAGGWAVAIVDPLPAEIVSGQPTPIGFRLLQHGVTPWVCECVRVRANHVETGEQVLVTPKADEIAGHYTALITFTKPGEWKWAVSSGLEPEWQEMKEITVLEGEPAAAASTGLNLSSTSAGAFLDANAGTVTILGLVVTGLVAAIGGLYLRRRRSLR